jgi:hypothetical protein
VTRAAQEQVPPPGEHLAARRHCRARSTGDITVGQHAVCDSSECSGHHCLPLHALCRIGDRRVYLYGDSS